MTKSDFYNRSTCCGQPVKVESDDEEGTNFYTCTACDNACDVVN